MVARGWGRGKAELVFDGYGVLVWEGEKVLETDGGKSWTTMRRHPIPQNRALNNG